MLEQLSKIAAYTREIREVTEFILNELNNFEKNYPTKLVLRQQQLKENEREKFIQEIEKEVKEIESRVDFKHSNPEDEIYIHGHIKFNGIINIYSDISDRKLTEKLIPQFKREYGGFVVPIKVFKQIIEDLYKQISEKKFDEKLNLDAKKVIYDAIREST